jgi:hypothetical protein
MSEMGITIESRAAEIREAAAKWSEAVACSLRDAAESINACAVQFQRMGTVVIRLREAMPPPARLKNTHLQREDWRGHGKRRARLPR